MADSARLPSQRVLLEQLVLSTIHAVLREASWMPGLRLDFRICLTFSPGLLLWNRFRKPLKVLLAELELPHGYRLC